MSTPVEQIKARLSIVDVVGSYIKLDKAGGSYKALCPFHNEKSPSFNVSPARDGYYCFGCNRGGDIFNFVQEIEGVEFIDALRTLADRAGVELKREAHESHTERDRLLALMEDVTILYESNIKKNHEVLEYLKGRGLTDETIHQFRIGFAPLEWRLAYEYLRTKDYTDQEIERAGITKAAEGKGYYDRLRGRVMFPIFDGNGRVVAFSGRVFGNQKNNDGTEVAKYINSPETPLYDKSAILFGYDRARVAIRKQNFSVLVEGQMDLIMAHQAGVTNAVAVSGTALTERHLALLKRLSDNVVFAFDADDAGMKATARAFRLALLQGLNVRVATIPDSKDPADYIKAHPLGFAEVVANSKHIVEFALGALSGKGYDQARMREEVAHNVLPLIVLIQSKIEQAHFIIEVARKLGVPETAVWEDVARVQRAEQIVSQVHDGRDEARGVQAPPQTPKSRRHIAEEELLSILFWQKEMDDPVVDVTIWKSHYHERLQAHGLSPHTPNEDESRTLIIKAEHKYTHGPELADSLEELLDTIETEVLREKQAELWRKIGEAEISGSKEEAKKILESYQEITPRIIALEDRRLKRN